MTEFCGPEVELAVRQTLSGTSVGTYTVPLVNVDDLEWQTRRYSGLSPRGVSLLLEHGHLDLVIQAAADRGEWFCAEGAVEELCRAGNSSGRWT